MARTRLPIAAWRPDLAAYPVGVLSPYATEVSGVYHQTDGYTPLKSFVAASGVGSGRALGAASFLDKTGGTFVVKGTADALESLNDNQGYTDRTRSSGAYTTGADERWRFQQFGDNIVATNFTNVLQVLNMTSDTLFADLAGSPPRGRLLSSLRDSIVVGNTNNSEAEIYGSSQNDIEEWSVGVGASLAWKRTLPFGGPVRAMMETDALYVFQQTAIRRVTYIGDALVVDVDVISEDEGVAVAASFVRVGGVGFYIGEDGFKQFAPGQGVIPIGHQKVDRWLLDNLDRGQLANVAASFDPFNKLIAWALPTTASTDGYPDTVVFYNYYTQEFGKASIAVDELFLARSVPTLLDNITTNLEDIETSFDSAAYAGGVLVFGAFDNTGRYGRFEGTNVEAVLETGDAQIGEGVDAYVQYAEPIDDAELGSVTPAARHSLVEAIEFETARPVGAAHRARIRRRGRYHRFRRTIPAGTDWERAQAISVEWRPAGRWFGVRRLAPAGMAVNVTLDDVTLAGTVYVPASPVLAELDATLGAVTVTSFAGALVAAELDATLGAVTLASQGLVYSDVSATLDVTLSAVTLSAAGLVTDGPTAELIVTLGAVTLDATAGVENRAVFDATLGAVTLNAAAGVTNRAVLTSTLGAVTLTSAGTVGSSETTPADIAGVRGYVNAMFSEAELYQEITGASASTVAAVGDPVGTIKVTDASAGTIYFTTPYTTFRGVHRQDSSGNTRIEWSGDVGYTSTYMPPTQQNARSFVMGVDTDLTSSNPAVRHLFQYGDAATGQAFGLSHKGFGNSNLHTANWGFSETKDLGTNINSSSEDPNVVVLQFTTGGSGVRSWVDGVQGTTNQGGGISNTGTTNNLALGSRQDAATTITETAHGYIYGIIVFEFDLTSSERTAMETYVQARMA